MNASHASPTGTPARASGWIRSAISQARMIALARASREDREFDSRANADSEFSVVGQFVALARGFFAANRATSF